MVAVRYPTAFKLYPYERSSDQDSTSPIRHPVVIVGGGPIGMALALDLGQKNIPCVVLDDHDGVGMVHAQSVFPNALSKSLTGWVPVTRW